MLLCEYKLRLSRSQAAAIEEAIRTTQFIRNKALRMWMDGRGVSANDLQVLCSRLAQEYPFATALNSQARQAAASRAWAAIERFYTNCREQRPGKKGYPRFQHDCRSVEYKQTGWQLDAEGKRLTLTDGSGIGPMRLIGSRELATFPVEQVKRVRLVRRADGYYAQFVLQVERRIEHVPTGSAVGIDVGIAAYVTDSDGQAVANPRFIRLAEARLKRYQRRLSRRSVYHKKGKKPRNNHAARQRARHNLYPTSTAPSQPPQPITSPRRQSANWGKAKQQVGRVYLHLQRQREDFARKTASALISSHDLIALEDLQVRNLVRNRRLAKAISDVSWSRLRHWVEYYGRLHEVPVVAVPPAFTSQDCSGVLPNGKPCRARIRKSLSMRTHICPRCGLILDRDENAALNILARGVVLAREQGCWPRPSSGTSRTSELRGTVGHTET
jgi:putative transposase